MKRFFEKYSVILWIFIIGSLIGFAHENLLMFFRGRYALRQGLIYEPLIPVYGAGALVFFFLYKNIDIKAKNAFVKVLVVFLLGFLVGGAVEYLFSFLQEEIFGTVSWNYSKHRFNLNGRISLKYSCVWGLIGVLFYYLILPLFLKLYKVAQKKYFYIISIIFSIILLFDCTISILACYRQAERRNNEPPSNKLDYYLDKHYPDEYLNAIYNNARVRKS